VEDVRGVAGDEGRAGLHEGVPRSADVALRFRGHVRARRVRKLGGVGFAGKSCSLRGADHGSGSERPRSSIRERRRNHCRSRCPVLAGDQAGKARLFEPSSGVDSAGQSPAVRPLSSRPALPRRRSGLSASLLPRTRYRRASHRPTSEGLLRAGRPLRKTASSGSEFSLGPRGGARPGSGFVSWN